MYIGSVNPAEIVMPKDKKSLRHAIPILETGLLTFPPHE